MSIVSPLAIISFQDPNLQLVVAGTVLVGMASALIGCFAFLRRRALVGDAVAHSVLPGIALAFLIGGSRSLVVLLPGAFISGLFAMWSIDAISRHSRIKPDAATGLVLSVFFGTGILLLTWIQHSRGASQAGLDRFLFGQAAAILPNDLWLFAAVALLLGGVLFGGLFAFRLVSFDPDFARAIGMPVKLLEAQLSMMTVLAVVVGVQTVGVVLMAALLITPAAAARFWTDRLGVMMLLAAMFAALGGVFGSLLSYVAPKQPTGPWIIVSLSILALMSMAFAPKRGWIAKRWQQRRYRLRILRENVLKAFYHVAEEREGGIPDAATAPILRDDELLERRAFPPRSLARALRRLQARGLVSREGEAWRISPAGLGEGARLARIHRLWELYLTRYLHIAPDHVHDDAEAMEHLITPELEAELESLLDYPERDPHDRDIPRGLPYSDALGQENPEHSVTQHSGSSNPSTHKSTEP